MSNLNDLIEQSIKYSPTTNWQKEHGGKTELRRALAARANACQIALIKHGYSIIACIPIGKRPSLSKEDLAAAKELCSSIPPDADRAVITTLEDHILLFGTPDAPGPFYWHNYGYSKDGVMAVDLEGPEKSTTDGEYVSGRNWLIDQGISLEGFGAPVTKSPGGGGGEHVIFINDPKLKNKNHVFAKSIGLDIKDTCLGYGINENRYLIGPGSVVPQGPYTGDWPLFLDEIEIPNISKAKAFVRLPQIQALMHGDKVSAIRPDIGVNPFPGTGRGFEDVSSDDLGDVPATTIKEVLAAIPCADLSYDEWLKAGSILHWWSLMGHDRDKEAYDMFQGWSATDPGRFDEKTCRVKWESFHSAKVKNPARIGTLILMAKQYGYRPKGSGTYLAAMEEINENYPNVFIAGQSKFVRIQDNGRVAFSTEKDVKSWYANQPVIINGKPTNPITPFMTWPGRTKYESAELYPPGAPPCPSNVLNTWSGFRIAPAKGNTKPWDELIERLVPDDEVRTWLEDWLADCAQTPGRKIDTSPVFSGPEGCGKNTLINAFSTIFKEANHTQYISTDQFLGQHNEDPLTMCLVVVNEAVWAGSPKAANELKGRVSESSYKVNPKNIRPYDARNNCRYVIMTNEEWSVPAGLNARRWCCIKVDYHKEWPKGDPKWGELARWLNDDRNISAVFWKYLNRKITVNLRQVPETAELKKQKRQTKERNKNDPNKVWEDVLGHLICGSRAYQTTEGKWTWGNDLISQAYEHLNNRKANSQFPSVFRGKVNDHLGKYGAKLTAHNPLSVSTGGTAHTGGVITPTKKTMRGSYVPDIGVLARAYEQHMFLKEGECERGDAWSLPGDNAEDIGF